MSKSLSNAPLYVAPYIYAHSPTCVVDEQNGDKQLYPLTTNNKILIYEREVNGWFLDVASELIDKDMNNNTINNGFVALMILFSYIEGVQQYKMGMSSNRHSEQFFCDGFKEIFTDIDTEDNLIKNLYRNARCGLFHNGMVGNQILIDYKFDLAINFNDTIKINPLLFLNAIQLDFNRYITLLKDENNQEIRKKFIAIFSID
ncbi:hypothetical protein [Kineothrix sp. MB12-C1]|uniref:hypothetical protein n=1 Tax=Kineothrix sp. MB12-C1 TaxID=3070215 RepID=UPI0027D2EE5E|nr:hypothetical protein [Kineothrix sp. MB12-C1]WMC93216.1 hypothetical protein RBB56_02720 [Kineothrix sp. MB12-C1]